LRSNSPDMRPFTYRRRLLERQSRSTSPVGNGSSPHRLGGCRILSTTRSCRPLRIAALTWRRDRPHAPVSAIAPGARPDLPGAAGAGCRPHPARPPTIPGCRMPVSARPLSRSHVRRCDQFASPLTGPGRPRDRRPLLREPRVQAGRPQRACGWQRQPGRKSLGDPHQLGAGGIHQSWAVHPEVLISDHINLTADSPLRGATFVDLTDLYSARLRAIARRYFVDEGVYASSADRTTGGLAAAETRWRKRSGGPHR
jgi:hypothetical protein